MSDSIFRIHLLKLLLFNFAISKQSYSLNKNTYKAHLALLGANLIYGVNHIVAKDVMPTKIGPSAFVFLRIFFAGILFWIIKTNIKDKVAKKDFPLLIACGILDRKSVV